MPSVKLPTIVPPTFRFRCSVPATPLARTVIVLPPPLEDDEVELLELDELLDELELLEELDELLELLLEDELLELLELDELLLLDEEPLPAPLQDGSTKLPSWLP